MKGSFIVKHWLGILLSAFIVLLLFLYVLSHWYSYFILDREERKFVKAALSGVENVELCSMFKNHEKRECDIRIYFWNRDNKIETFNVIRENMNQYLRSHPEWDLSDYKLWVSIIKKGSRIPVVHFYNYDDNPNNPEKWDALLYVRGDGVAMKTTAESILCLSDCKKLELKSSLEDWNILKHFKDLEYLIVDGLTEEEKEQIKKILPNCQVWAG